MSQPLLPHDLVDRAPETDEEVAAIRIATRIQLGELGVALKLPLTCACGQQTILALACRCSWCGLFFCRSCADRHFGRAPAEAAKWVGEEVPHA